MRMLISALLAKNLVLSLVFAAAAAAAFSSDSDLVDTWLAACVVMIIFS